MADLIFDPHLPEHNGNPHALFRQLREQGPVTQVRDIDGLLEWYVLPHAEVDRVLRDKEALIKDFNAGKSKRQRQAELRNPSLMDLISHQMLFQDPPDHTRIRRLTHKAMDMREIDLLRPGIERRAHALIDQFADKGEVNLLEDYAVKLPIQVIADVLGVPEDDHPKLRRWADGAFDLLNAERPRAQVMPVLESMVSHLNRYFAERRANPTDDLISRLIQVRDEQDALSDIELYGAVSILIEAGHETVSGFINNAVLTLLKHPDALQQLKENPELWPQAQEELLRYEGPLKVASRRWAKEDFQIGDHVIKRGEIVRAAVGSANRDPDAFQNPDELDLTRDFKQHHTFGMGIHFCLGAALARMESEIALRVLFERLPDLRLGFEPEFADWRMNVMIRGLRRLPLVW